MIYDFFNPYGGLNTMSDNYVTGDNIYERELQNFFFQTLGMMSITHYGAIGDGRRDNYGPLQVAIDDANRRGLNYIYVPYGRYIYTGELLHEGSVTFVGNPHAKIINIRTGKEIPIGQFGSSLGIETVRYDIYKLAKALGEYVDYTGDIDQGYYYTIDEDNSLEEVEKENTANFIADARVLYSRVKIKGQCIGDSMYYVVDNEGNVLYASPKNMRFTELTDVILNIPFGGRQVIFNFTNTDQNIPEMWLLDIESISTKLEEKQDKLIAGEGISIVDNVISVEDQTFWSCPFPTSWTGTSTEATATNTWGEWTISTDANISEGSVSNTFDNNLSTKVALYLNVDTPKSINIELPAGVTIKPKHIKLSFNGIGYNNSKNAVFQGFDGDDWETIYTVNAAGYGGVWDVDTDVTPTKYYSKFRFSNLVPVAATSAIDDYLYDIQITSGFIKGV